MHSKNKDTKSYIGEADTEHTETGEVERSIISQEQSRKRAKD